MEVILTDSNFEEEVKKSTIPVMVDFYADWCGPCKMMAPLVAQLSEEYSGRCKIAKCNVTDYPGPASEYKIMSIPAFLFFKEGKVVDSVVGAVSKNELAGKIEQVLA
ncbi:MAG: thioredoxin [Suilimivivens sp.]|nr:thioredoxin [Lachnospiraceae bacterium]MDY5869866.1 thioredoxin [Lachnospiraceae bacterium]